MLPKRVNWASTRGRERRRGTEDAGFGTARSEGKGGGGGIPSSSSRTMTILSSGRAENMRRAERGDAKEGQFKHKFHSAIRTSIGLGEASLASNYRNGDHYLKESRNRRTVESDGKKGGRGEEGRIGSAAHTGAAVPCINTCR